MLIALVTTNTSRCKVTTFKLLERWELHKNAKVIGKKWAFWEEMAICLAISERFREKKDAILDNSCTFAYTKEKVLISQVD